MNEQLRLLVDLQNLDALIISMKRKIEIAPLRITNEQNELNAAIKAYESANQEMLTLEKKKREKERNIEEIDLKITKLKNKSSEIKTNKEYQAFIKEVEGMQKELSKAEDELLLIMEKLDEYKKAIENKKAKVKEEEMKLEEIKKKLEAEKTKCEAELQAVQIKRKELVKNMEEDIYNLYINLFKSTNGLAVVEVRDEICHGCNLHIPPQQYVEIKSNKDIYTCPQCRRILYYKKKEEAALPQD